MSVARITQQTSLQANLRFQSRQGESLARLQEQAVSQKRIMKPSDDPAGTAKAIAVRNALAQNEQYARNSNDAQGWLNVTDSTLTQSTSLLQRVRDLTVQGANDSNSDASRAAISLEVTQLRDELISHANTKYLGRNVFAGTSSAVAAYDPVTYAYSGVPGEPVNRLIGESKEVRVDADGATAYGQGATSMFAELDNLITSLTTGTGISNQIGVIDDRIKSVIQLQAQIGSRQATVISAQESQLASKTNLTSDKSAVEDIDFAETYMKLQSAYNVQEASLNVLSRLANGPQLQDYL